MTFHRSSSYVFHCSMSSPLRRCVALVCIQDWPRHTCMRGCIVDATGDKRGLGHGQLPELFCGSATSSHQERCHWPVQSRVHPSWSRPQVPTEGNVCLGNAEEKLHDFRHRQASVYVSGYVRQQMGYASDVLGHNRAE